MSINELKDIVDAIAKRRDAYSVDEGLKDDALIIERVHDRFVVYYFERGSRFVEKWFENEADAVAHFHSKFEDSERWS